MRKKFSSWDECINLWEIKCLRKFNHPNLIKLKEVIKLQDELLISKYRKDYESAIINLEDLINFSMLKLALDMKTDISKDLKNIEMLNSLSKAKSSLNEVMKFIDKQ